MTWKWKLQDTVIQVIAASSEPFSILGLVANYLALPLGVKQNKVE